MIDTNLRSVKRTDNHTGATILNKATAKQRSLCGFCGQSDNCRTNKLMTNAQKTGIAGVITTCSFYTYPIHFVDMKGLDVPGCNTIRLGTTWARRLRPGDTVAVLDAAKKFQRFAAIRTVNVVPLTEAGLRPHAYKNHMLVGEEIGVGEAATKLLKILRNNYGNLVFKNNTEATVIGF